MAPDIPILLVLSTSLAGGLLGCLTGLVPGLHSNNAASSIGANPEILIVVASLGLVPMDGGDWVLAASCGVVACTVAHTVTNIIPSIYLAVPEGETALSVLPGHRMVMAGRGEEALRISVTSSLLSLTIALLLIVPVRWLMGPPFCLYGTASAWMAGILAGVTALMVLSEADKEHGNGRTGGWRATLAALVVVMSAGAMGHVVLFDVGLVGPLFIGLFGVPVILIAMEGERGTTGGPATSTGSVPRRFPLFPVVTGSLMGCLVGWFPGVSSAQATILAVPRREGEPDDMDGARRFIAGVSAVNTANAVFVLVALTTLLRIRSGAAVAVNALMEWDQPPWPFGTSPGLDVAMLVLSAAVGGLIGAPVTMVVGRRFQRSLPLLSHRVTLGLLLLMLVGLSYVTSGPMALPVVAVAGALGMVPPKLGLMRVHLMGVVTVPLVLGLGLL